MTKASRVSYISIRRFNASILMMFDRNCCIPKGNCSCVTIYLRSRNGISIQRARLPLAGGSQSLVALPALCAALTSTLGRGNFSWFRLSWKTDNYIRDLKDDAVTNHEFKIL